MNEELVLHILNTACYGLNLHLSLVPQPPYLYVFFDRSPDAVLEYGALTETLRLAAVSAGLPPDYEYLALYGRILGEEHPDWETAIYLYEATIPSPESSPELSQEAQETPHMEDAHVPEPVSDLISEPAEVVPESVSEPEPIVDFEALFGVQESVNDRIEDDFTRDPTIVFESNLPQELSLASTEDPTPAPLQKPATPEQPSNSQLAEEHNDPADLDFMEGLPLPPPPPPPRHLQTRSDRAPAVTTQAAQAEDDMSQYYFRAKPKPKVTPTKSISTALSTPPQTESSGSPIVPDRTEKALLEPTPPTTQAITDLSSYCFIRNKLMLSSSIKPPSLEVIALIAQLHRFTTTEKISIASLLDKIYRQPEKNTNEERAGEALLYQPADINLDEFSQPIQNLIQEVLALEPESLRKSAIWFSRYCYDPQTTIGELGINN